MSAHAWDGNSYKKITQRAYWTGSEWKNITSSHLWTGTEWKLLFSSFTPAGIILGANFQTSTVTTVTIPGMIANPGLPGTVVQGNGVVSATSGPVRIGFTGHFTTTSNNTAYLGIYKNGTLIGTESAGSVNYNGALQLMGMANTTLAVGDVLTLGYRNQSGAFATTVVANRTMMTISAEDQPVAIGGTEIDQTPPVGWSDIVFTPNPGTVMDGTSFVVQKSHPSAILTANVNCRSDNKSAIRILVNGNVVNTSSDIGGYDVRGGPAVSYPLAAGDRVKVQYNRISQFGTTIYTRSGFAVL